MKSIELSENIINTYIRLLGNLSANSKLELISRLSSSMKTNNKQPQSSLKSLFGAFESDLSADEMIADLKKERIFNRERPSL